MSYNLQNKKIAMIIAYKDFRDEEYFIPRDIFIQAGISVFTISEKKGIAIGVNGGEAIVDLILEELNCPDFDAIVFIGGDGMVKNIDNEEYHKIARDAVEYNKILGAICISPAILANAGVLDNKNATVWSDIMNKSAIKILKENNAIYQDKSVVIDNKIITANGPSSAQEFAQAIIIKLGIV